MVSLIISGIWVASVIFVFFMIYRNNKVYNYRMKLINKTTGIDPTKGLEYLEIIASVEYNEMMWKFWRKMDSFYPEWFLIELGVKKEKPTYIEDILK